MTSWADNANAPASSWVFIARIEGVVARAPGRPVEQIALTSHHCDWIAGPQFPVLSPAGDNGAVEFPDLLSEKLQRIGGISDQSASVRLVLAGDLEAVSQLFRLGPPVGVLELELAANSTTLYYNGLSRHTFAAGDPLYLNGEAMRVQRVNVSAITVERGAFDSGSVKHPGGSPVYAQNPFIIGRRLKLSLAPLDADGAADERLLGDYVVDGGPNWDSTFTTLTIDASLAPGPFTQTIPVHRREFDVEALEEESGSLYLVTEDRNVTKIGIRRHLLIGGEVVRFEYSGVAPDKRRTKLRVTARGVCGTPVGELAGSKHKAVLVVALDKGSADLAAREATMGGDSDLYPSDPVGLLYAILWSPVWFEQDGSFGLGVPYEDIDMESFERLRPHFMAIELRNTIIGDKAVEAKKWLEDNILKPLQLHLIRNNKGQLRLVSQHIQSATGMLRSIGPESIRLSGGGSGLPDFSFTRNGADQAQSVILELGNGAVKTTVAANALNATRSAKTLTFEIPGASTDPDQLQLWAGIARSLARELFASAVEGRIVVGAEHWDLDVGDVFLFSLPRAPRADGTLGRVVEEPCVVTYREPSFDDGAAIQIRFKYLAGGAGRAGSGIIRKIGPSAVVTARAGDVFTVNAHRFARDRIEGAPYADALSFQPGDAVELVDSHGRAGRRGTVVAVLSGRQLVLSGDVLNVPPNFQGFLVSQPLARVGDKQADRLAWLTQGASGGASRFEGGL